MRNQSALKYLLPLIGLLALFAALLSVLWFNRIL